MGWEGHSVTDDRAGHPAAVYQIGALNLVWGAALQVGALLYEGRITQARRPQGTANSSHNPNASPDKLNRVCGIKLCVALAAGG